MRLVLKLLVLVVLVGLGIGQGWFSDLERAFRGMMVKAGLLAETPAETVTSQLSLDALTGLLGGLPPFWNGLAITLAVLLIALMAMAALRVAVRWLREMLI